MDNKKPNFEVKKLESDSDEETLVEKTKKSSLKWLVTVIMVIAVILLVLYGVSRFTKFNVLGIDKTGTDGQWQAVFLSNGQVYFGNITKDGSKEVVLKNIYYLQVVAGQTSSGLQPSDQTQGAQQSLSLIKLGDELHGPKDEMFINKAHVVFIEDLRADGRVVTAIKKYIEDQKNK